MQSLLSDRMTQAKPSFLRQILSVANRPGMVSFAGGLPAPDLFDVEGIAAASETVLAKHGRTVLQYGASDGLDKLREQLVGFMARRGVENLKPEQFMVTTGSQQGIDLVAKTFLDKDDVVFLEEPTYLAALQTFGMYQPEFVGVVGDANGLDTNDLAIKVRAAKADGKRIKLVYVVANFANPTGATLSLERREELVRLAVQEDFLIVEDDPYGELRFSGEALPPVFAIAQRTPGATERCVYLSSFSKIFAPGLRVAWMVLPESLKQAVLICKQSTDLHTSTLGQYIAWQYMQSGALEARLPLLREQYQKRCNAMIEALERHLPGALNYNTPSGGMFLWAYARPGLEMNTVVQRAIENGVVFVPGQFFFPQDGAPHSLRLSYSMPTAEQLEQGMQRLAQSLPD